MGYLPSLGGKAAHLVSDLATVILNPVSGHERERSSHHLPEAAEGQENMYDDEESEIPNGPDTSSFRAFLMSFMSASSSSDDSMEIIPEQDADMEYPTLTPVGRGNKERKGLLSRGKHSIGKIINKAGRLGGFRQKPSHIIDGEIASQIESVSSGFRPKVSKESASNHKLPAMSEPSMLLSEMMRNVLYPSLPVLVQGKNWMLVYSTWRHGTSLSTLYRRSMLCAGDSLLIIGDKKGAVFGGLVEAPLRPIMQRKYQAWFRELPEGVLDSLSPEQVLNCNTEEQCVELVSHIPVTYAALLSWVVELMADVVEEEGSNKMNARNIAMVFAPNMTQMSDPLTALMHAVQVMNLLKTLVLKTLREREDDEGSYSTFSSSPTLSDGLDEVDRDQGGNSDSGTEKYGDDSSESSKNVDKATNLTMDSEQLIGSSRRHTSFEFRLPYTIDNDDDDDKYPSLSDIEEGFLRRLECQEVSKGGGEDEGSIFFTSTKEAEQLSSCESISESCRVSDQTSSTEDAVGTDSIEPTMQMETSTETTSEEATNAKEVS